MRFEIKAVDVSEKSGVGKRSGKPFKFLEQRGYMDVGKPYPVEVKFILEDGLVPLQPGVYELCPQCFYADRFGGVGVDLCKARPVVKPAAASAPGASAAVPGRVA